MEPSRQSFGERRFLEEGLKFLGSALIGMRCIFFFFDLSLSMPFNVLGFGVYVLVWGEASAFWGTGSNGGRRQSVLFVLYN